MRDPTLLGDVLRTVLGRLGLTDLEVWRRIEAEWTGLAGPPWDEQSVPRSLRSGILVVEAVDPRDVSLLRYGVDGLTRRLQAVFGPDVIEEIQIRAPRAGRR